MQVTINGQDISITQQTKLVSDTENIYEVSYVFSNDWEGYTKTAVIQGSSGSFAILLDENLTCAIPNELLATTGRIRFGMLGTKVVDGVTKRYPTVWSAYVDVAEASAGTDTPVTPTEDVYATILADLIDLETNKQAKLTAGTGITISDSNVISATANVSWGNISGTFTAQADLQSEIARLDGRCDNLQNLGRYLALWDCLTGKPTTNPTTMPYSYKAGDYYRVSTLATYQYRHVIELVKQANREYYVVTIYNSSSEAIDTFEKLRQWLIDNGYYATNSGVIQNVYTNITGSFYGSTPVDICAVSSNYIYVGKITEGIEYPFSRDGYSNFTSIADTVTAPTYYRPSGATYNDVASTTAETGNVAVGDVYFYDGNEWSLQINHLAETYTKAQIDAMLNALRTELGGN